MSNEETTATILIMHCGEQQAIKHCDRMIVTVSSSDTELTIRNSFWQSVKQILESKV